MCWWVAADVGLARMMDASHLSAGIAPQGTFPYAAPELLMGRRCDEKVCCAEVLGCAAYSSALSKPAALHKRMPLLLRWPCPAHFHLHSM